MMLFAVWVYVPVLHSVRGSLFFFFFFFPPGQSHSFVASTGVGCGNGSEITPGCSGVKGTGSGGLTTRGAGPERGAGSANGTGSGVAYGITTGGETGRGCRPGVGRG